mmetsp:Transcript_87201/g.244687  ORF Transcript_87201/g.244687 Transcript_87201/m.244687 type:complete len:254 (+) Transcript_87201:233-994(+)
MGEGHRDRSTVQPAAPDMCRCPSREVRPFRADVHGLRLGGSATNGEVRAPLASAPCEGLKQSTAHGTKGCGARSTQARRPRRATNMQPASVQGSPQTDASADAVCHCDFGLPAGKVDMQPCGSAERGNHVVHRDDPATGVEVVRNLLTLRWCSLLLHRHVYFIVGGVDCLAKVDVVEVEVVAKVAVNAGKQAHIDLSELEAEGAHSTSKLVPRDKASAAPVHVLKHWLEQDPALLHPGPDFVLDLADYRPSLG